MSAHPEFDRARAFYVGLNKISDAYVVGTHTVPTTTFDAKARVRASGALSPAGVLGAVSGSGSVESGVSHESVSDITARSQLLAIAPQVFGEVAKEATAAQAHTRYEIGRNYYYSGSARFRVRTHDDFRAEGDHETAPRLGLWLLEIPDSQPGSSATSVTWVVLSGTAQGQLSNVLGGQVSDWRGGSQTEHLFELLQAKMAGEDRKTSDERWLRDPFYALAARNMLSDSQQQTVEVLFACLEVHACPTEGDDREVSYLDWSDASRGREVPVSKVILGTPYFVQLTPQAATTPSQEEKTLWRRFLEYFGLVDNRVEAAIPSGGDSVEFRSGLTSGGKK